MTNCTEIKSYTDKSRRDSAGSLGSKSVTFDYVEVLEFSENDDEEVPDQLPETSDSAKEEKLEDQIPPLKISK